jgi:hypothetical protein
VAEVYAYFGSLQQPTVVVQFDQTWRQLFAWCSVSATNFANDDGGRIAVSNWEVFKKGTVA